MSDTKPFRMATWLVLSLIGFALSYLLHILPGPTEAGLFPRLQVILWKSAFLNAAVHWTYWVARNKLGRLDLTAGIPPIALALEKLAFALFFGLSIVAWALVCQ